MKKYRLAIFASGNGSNSENIARYFSEHKSVEVVLLLSNNSQAPALAKAKRLGLEVMVFDREDFKEGGRVVQMLIQKEVTHLVLAGFLWLVPAFLIRLFPDRIVNIHPALLPKFGGKGMYGRHVHEAVKNAGEQESGITIHLVNEHFDEGAPLLQAKCKILPADSVDEIAKKVQDLEYVHYPPAIEKWLMKS